jgi:hypothetical protein
LGNPVMQGLLEVGTFFFWEHGLDIVLSFWRIVIFLMKGLPTWMMKNVSEGYNEGLGKRNPNKLPGATNASERILCIGETCS